MVCNRGIGDGYQGIRAEHRVLWTHDLPHNGFALHPERFRGFSRVVFMSDYAERVWRGFFPQIGKSVKIPNGVDKGLFYPREKDLRHLIYISAPNRGLAKLPLIFEAVSSRTDAPVSMTAYSNLKVLHPNEPGDNELPREECRRVGIDLRDPIPQAELAKELGSAGLMVLPSN
jgi:glycosyltransferase involved in cell wall biosynthesis